MAAKIPDDLTIIENWHRFTYPREYVAGVRHRMLNCVRLHGNAVVKLGITGSGQKPCFRITYTDGGGAEVIFGSYWDNMDPLVNERAESENWSSKSVAFEEVDAFLKEKVGHTTRNNK